MKTIDFCSSKIKITPVRGMILLKNEMAGVGKLNIFFIQEAFIKYLLYLRDSMRRWDTKEMFSAFQGLVSIREADMQIKNRTTCYHGSTKHWFSTLAVHYKNLKA